jgi:tetratricopeptide (TPR) repeat protein
MRSTTSPFPGNRAHSGRGSRPAFGRRSIVAALLVCLAGAVSGVLVAQTVQPVKYSRLQRLEQWTEALERHQPAEKDAALETFADWTAPEFAELKISFYSALQIVRDPSIRTFFRPPLPNGRPSTQAFYSRDEVRQLVDVAKRLRKLGESHMLRRGAMLHLDAVVLGSGNDARKGSRRSDFFIYHMDDGQALGQQDALGQWDFARFLLEQIHPDPDDVRPRPSDDDWVRRWYRTLLAYQLSQMHFNVADAERGLELFPSDPEILFLEGVLHEALSSPAIQEPLRNSEQTRQSALVRSAGGELDLAEDLLRRAVKRDPTFVEARLHLGRVLVERNNHKAALPELTQVLSKIQDRILQYYGQMFLGRSAAGIGDMAGARAAFERASQLVPAAQSPPLALSQLAYARGDTDEATALLQRLAELPSLERDDPWWFYNTTAGRFFAPSHQEIAADLRKEMPQ